MERISMGRLVEGLKYKTIRRVYGRELIDEVTIIKVTAKSVTYKVGNLAPETERLGKYKQVYQDLPYEASEADIFAHHSHNAYKADLKEVQNFRFDELKPSQLSEVLLLLRSF